MFVIARQHRGTYTFRLVQHYVQRDLTDGTDSEDQYFVDQLDFDGDGQDEVVTIVWFYESNEYRVYARHLQTDRWYELYRGGGGGC
jgi:hypothetical protein